MIKKLSNLSQAIPGLTTNQKKIMRNVNWLMGAYLYRFITGLVAMALVTRYLGPEQYGVYAYSLSFFSFLEIILNLVNQEVFKKEVLGAKDSRQLINTYFIFIFLTSLALIALTLGVLWGFDLEIGDRRFLISILTLSLFFRSADVLSYVLNVKMRNDLISRAELAATSTFNFTRIGLTFIKASLPWFAATVILQKLVNFSFTFNYYRSVAENSLATKDFDLKIVTSLINKSFPLFLASASTIIFTRIDQLMIGNLLSDYEVGLYSIVVKLSETWAFASTILSQAVYPSLIQAYNTSISDFNHKVQKSLTILFYLALSIILFTLLFSDQMINLFSSKDYISASPILRVQIISVLFLFWQNISNQYEIIVGAAKFTLIKTGIASVLNIILNYFLIERIGILGASLATIFSYSLATYFLNVFYYKTRGFFFLQSSAFMFWRTKWFS